LKEKWENYPLRIILAPCVACIAITIAVSTYFTENLIKAPLELENVDLQEKNRQLKDEIENITRSIKQKKDEITKLRNDLLNAANKIAAITNKKEEIRKLEGNFKIIDQDISKLSEDYFINSEELDNLKRRMRVFKNDVVSYSKITKLEPVINRLKFELESKKQIKEDIKKELDKLKK